VKIEEALSINNILENPFFQKPLPQTASFTVAGGEGVPVLDPKKPKKADDQNIWKMRQKIEKLKRFRRSDERKKMGLKKTLCRNSFRRQWNGNCFCDKQVSSCRLLRNFISFFASIVLK